MFYHTYIRNIPYLEYIEVPVSFAETNLCSKYKDISLQITATCERPTTRSQVYQYEVGYNSSTGIVEIQYGKRRGAENSTFSIDELSWAPNQATSTSMDCNCNNGAGDSAESYYSGYGGGVGGGVVDGGNGGGKSTSEYMVNISLVSFGLLNCDS